MAYLMESEREAERLLAKGDEQSTHDQLVMTGLKKGMHALDAGGGAGFVTRIMAQIVGADGCVTIADGSESRLKAAREYNETFQNIEFCQTSLETLPSPDDHFDYIFCRFVFEYLQNPDIVLQEFVRVTKPGDKIVIADLDNNILSHFPLPKNLEGIYMKVVQELISKKLWDPYMGRKLYSLAYNAGLENIKVHLLPHHLIYGELQKKDRDNMEAKLLQIEEMQEKGLLSIKEDLKEFRRDFMLFFESRERFSYSPLMIVEATKPKIS